MNEARRQRYARAKPIAFAAMELEPTRRDTYVDAACGGDEALREEVLWMLEAAEDTSDAPLLLPLLSGDLHDDSGASVAGAEACRYRLVRQLGEGGMGVVYLAERVIGEGSAEEIRQHVALKFIHSGSLLTAGARRRFADERRILGSLNHPGIANLIDGGSTCDGRPFLALEYVEGVRIDQWCEQRELSLRRRVVLFLKVCAAVRHAHERLVIHRDIKPANILVTPEGEPKLLDFGIARLLDQVGGVTDHPTMTLQRALTLAYASPEQVRGEALGTRADVWSLGVVLYQLVCGERPFGAVDTESPLELSQAIVAGRIVPPSRRLRGEARRRAGRREVPADIDAIVMKALRRNPAERYATVAELAADLENFLDLRPVRARRGHRWYRIGLYLKRHRVGLGVAAVMLAMLSGFLVEREGQLRRVELERDKTQAIAGFMQDLFENADPTHAGGSHVTVRQVLDRGAATLASRTDIAPEVRVRLMLSMARSYNQLGLGKPAVSLMKRALALQAGYAPDPLEQADVYAALGRGYSTVMDQTAAIAANERAIALYAEDPGDHDDAIVRVRINQLYNHLGVLDIPLDEIRRQIGGIVATLELESGRHDPELHVQALAILALTDGAMGSDAQAIGVARRAVEESTRLFVADDTNRLYYRFVEALVTLRSRPAQALEGFRRALDDYDKLIGTASPTLALMLGYFGDALAQMGRTEDAVQALERAASIAAQFADDTPDFYFATLHNLAVQYRELGRDQAARALLLPHLKAMRARLASGSVWSTTNLADVLNVMGGIALSRGEFAAARDQYRRSRDLLGPRERQASPASYATSLAGLGQAALARGDIARADTWLATLRSFNAEAHLAMPAPPAQDEALLATRLALVKKSYAQAASTAAVAAAQSETRWGPCSRRAVALRDLERQARQHLAAGAASAPAACAAGPRLAMP